MKIQILSLGLFFFAQFLVFGLAGQYQDKHYIQDYAEKFENTNQEISLKKVRSDRNERIQILTNETIQFPDEKTIKPDQSDAYLGHQVLLDVEIIRGNFVYLSSKALFSQSNGGKWQVNNPFQEKAKGFCLEEADFALIYSSNELYLMDLTNQKITRKILKDTIIQVKYDRLKKEFYLLTNQGFYSLKKDFSNLKTLFQKENLSSFEIYEEKIFLTSNQGLYELTLDGNSQFTEALPNNHLRIVKSIHGKLWFGSKKGAFKLRDDGKYDYYASKRWVVDDEIIDISEGPNESVLVLSKTGLSILHFDAMNLAEKANYFQKIQRKRHIRYGFESSVDLKKPGDLSTWVLRDTDNDGLWTSMYLAGELFRFGATGAKDAKENAIEAFQAMARLTEISGIPGFPARTFARNPYQTSDWKQGDTNGIWQLSPEGDWAWKSTTSSDESCGHFFVYALMAEIIQEEEWKNKAIALMKSQMDHIIENDWYLVSWDGKPTRWGKWHPDYVNSFPINNGDRRLNSTLILAFLQSTYHFTQEEKYKTLAYELMEKYGYEENACRPASVIGYIENEPLSDGWNHSDDEMYFLTAPAFVKYAFDEAQRKRHLEAVRTHWEIERDEKNPLWNFLYALSGGENIDLQESIWWLKEYPLDLIDWKVDNSERKDLVRIEKNFRNKEYAEVLPRDERPHHLHNREYVNHGGSGGYREYSPYVFLLPYWAGRYIGMIQ